MMNNDKLLQQFMQAGIDKLEIEDLLSDSLCIACIEARDFRGEIM